MAEAPRFQVFLGGLYFGDQGLGFRIQISGLRFQDLGLGVPSVRLRGSAREEWCDFEIRACYGRNGVGVLVTLQGYLANKRGTPPPIYPLCRILDGHFF